MAERMMTTAERKANLPLDDPHYWEKVAQAEPITVERVAELEHCLSVVRAHRDWLAEELDRYRPCPAEITFTPGMGTGTGTQPSKIMTTQPSSNGRVLSVVGETD